MYLIDERSATTQCHALRAHSQNSHLISKAFITQEGDTGLPGSDKARSGFIYYGKRKQEKEVWRNMWLPLVSNLYA